MENESLIDCLEYCIAHLTSIQEKDSDNNILDLWYMIGVQGPGILSHDLEYLYKLTFEEKEDEKAIKEKLEKQLSELLNLSVIEQENIGELTATGQTKKYRVSTFIDKYIQQKMEKEKRKTCLEIICGHLNSKLQNFKEEYVKDLKEIAE